MKQAHYYKFGLLLALAISFAASAQTMGEQLKAMRAEQDRVKAEEDAQMRQIRADQEARQRAVQERDRVRQEQMARTEKEKQDQIARTEKEKQQQAFELEKKRIDANQSIEKERLAAAREQQARAAKERSRTQAYEEEQRRLDLMERKAALATRRAKADRSNDYIDRELNREDAKTNIVNSNADANRNLSEGGRDMLKGIGKGVERHGLEKKSD